MSDIARLLEAVERGESKAAHDLIPVVYDELRQLASQHLAREKPGQTLQATALVHEAYLRLVTTSDDQWANRRHFFAAAAEAMQRILVENARRKKRLKHGGQQERVELDEAGLSLGLPADDILAVQEALENLGRTDPDAARLVKLRFFTGLTLDQAAEVMDVSPRTADNIWAFGRAWMQRFIRHEQTSS
jgi:RNA polymerase sigma factor (TIGR02999 family)